MKKISLLLFLCFLATPDVWAQQPVTNNLPSVVQEKRQEGRPPTIKGIPGGVPVFSIKDWKEWIIEDEGFAITSPVFPAQRSRPVENAQVKFVWREFIVSSHTGRYEVRIADGMGRHIETKEVVKQRLELASQGLMQDPEYSEVSRNFLELNSFPAVDVKYKFAKGVGLGWIRMTMVDGRIYQLNVEVPAKDGWPKEAELFINSFRLLENAGLQSISRRGETIYQATANLKPKIISRGTLKYPDLARRNGVEGTVILSAIFTSEGKVTDIRIIRGLPDGLNEEAMKAAAQTKFKPAMKDGQPVNVQMTMEFGFHRMKE